MRNFRKKDYIIAFIIICLVMIMNIFPQGNILQVIFKTIFASIVGAMIIGTITNLLFRKK